MDINSKGGNMPVQPVVLATPCGNLLGYPAPLNSDLANFNNAGASLSPYASHVDYNAVWSATNDRYIYFIRLYVQFDFDGFFGPSSVARLGIDNDTQARFFTVGREDFDNCLFAGGQVVGWRYNKEYELLHPFRVGAGINFGVVLYNMCEKQIADGDFVVQIGYSEV